MRKKLTAAGFILVMAMGIAACGKSEGTTTVLGNTTEALAKVESTTSSEMEMPEETTTAAESTTEEKKNEKEEAKADKSTEESQTVEETTPIKGDVMSSTNEADSKKSALSSGKTPSKNTSSKNKNTNKDKTNSTKKDKNTNKTTNTSKDKNNSSTKKPSKKPTTKPAKKPTTDKNDKTNKDTAKKVSLQKIVDAVKKAYGDAYLPNTVIEKDILAEQYGVTENLYEEVIAEGPALSFQIDTFIAVKAKKGKASAVKKALENYKKYLIEESMQYPMNAAKIPAAQVYNFGDYVFFSMLVTPQGEEPETEEEYLAAAKKMNQKAYNTIKKMLK